MQQEQPLAPTAHAAEPLQAEPVAHHSSLGNGGVETSHTAARDPIPQTMAPKEAKSLHKHLEKEASREDDHIKSQVKEIGKVSSLSALFSHCMIAGPPKVASYSLPPECSPSRARQWGNRTDNNARMIALE